MTAAEFTFYDVANVVLAVITIAFFLAAFGASTNLAWRVFGESTWRRVLGAVVAWGVFAAWFFTTDLISW